MGEVRPFQPGDVERVARLWQRTFRHPHASSLPAIGAHLRDVLLDSPWADPEIPSLVYEEGGEVVGFVGAMPRRMRLGARTLRVAVATQLMVERGAGRGLAAFSLLRALFAGAQDLTYSDGANELSQRIWQRAGGSVAALYCLEWTRVLRPARFALHEAARRRGRLRRLAPAAAAPLGVFDSVVVQLPRSPFRAPEAVLHDEEAGPHELARCIATVPHALRPDYDASSLAWLLRAAGEARAQGELRAALVKDASGRVLGWYVRRTKRGGVCHVLQLGARDDAAPAVLDALFARAHAEGAIAVSGSLDPRHLRDLSGRRCRLACRAPGVLAHARDREVVDVILRGDAFLSRLEGEWWMRFGADRRVRW